MGYKTVSIEAWGDKDPLLVVQVPAALLDAAALQRAHDVAHEFGGCILTAVSPAVDFALIQVTTVAALVRVVEQALCTIPSAQAEQAPGLEAATPPLYAVKELDPELKIED